MIIKKILMNLSMGFYELVFKISTIQIIQNNK